MISLPSLKVARRSVSFPGKLISRWHSLEGHGSIQPFICSKAFLKSERSLSPRPQSTDFHQSPFERGLNKESLSGEFPSQQFFSEAWRAGVRLVKPPKAERKALPVYSQDWKHPFCVNGGLIPPHPADLQSDVQAAQGHGGPSLPACQSLHRRGGRTYYTLEHNFTDLFRILLQRISSFLISKEFKQCF